MSKQDCKMIIPKKGEGTIWIASFDIGKKNFAFYIEEMDCDELLSLDNIPERKQYNMNGTPTSEMQNLLDQVCMNGITILHKNSDLTENCQKDRYLDPETFHNMVDLLDKYSEYWDKCSYFVIEQQMSFGKNKRNTMALKLGQHCYSYFTIRYGRFKRVVEFPAYHKTQVLGTEKIRGKRYKNGNYQWKTIDKPTRKKWSITRATELLHFRGEVGTIDNIKTKAKKDDLADTFCQLQAFKYLCFVAKTI